MRILAIQIFVSSLFFLCEPVVVGAQTTTSGGLTGVITDQSGAVVPGASVELKDNGKGLTESTKTDREGVYRYFFLAPASYTLSVTHDGFSEERRSVKVLLGSLETVNVALTVAKANSEITVTDAPFIQAETAIPLLP